jgi:hypothetical protein
MKSHNFNRAHFPVGTLFTAGTVATGVHEVTGVSCNGPDSWVVDTNTPEPAFTHGGFKSINVQWVDAIVKRGEGRVLIKTHRHRLEGYDSRVAMLSAYTGGWSSMISSMLLHHPAYRDDACDHLYDYQLIIDALMHHFGERYYVGVINKKKFHKVFKAALTKAKTNRRKAQLVEQRQDMEMYKEDMGLEDINFGSDDDDESEDHQGDDPFPIVPQEYIDRLSGTDNFDHLDSSEID